MSAKQPRAMSDRMKRVLLAVVQGEVRFNPNGIDGRSWLAGTYKPVHSSTLRALEVRGLIRRPARRGAETEAAWEPTDKGRQMLARMGGA